MKVLIVSDHATAHWGGEAVLPLQFFRGLRARGVDAWLCVSEANRAELDLALADDRDRVRYVAETPFIKRLKHLHAHGPSWFPRYLFFFLAILALQRRQTALVTRLVDELGIDLVHQPTPVSPRIPSFLGRVPHQALVVGPLNGAMVLAPGFAALQTPLKRYVKILAQLAGRLIGLVIDGRRHADLVLVANERTREALPRRQRERSEILVENGVDPKLWSAPRIASAPEAAPFPAPLRVIFVGRLEPWKGVPWLLEAAARTMATTPLSLTIVGDFGDERARLAEQCQRLGIAAQVQLTGWIKQEDCARLVREADVFVLPSVNECGGAVVLEAMAAGKPVIAVAWGGPADYLDASCGVLIEPRGPERLVDDLTLALLTLASEPERRKELGEAARARALGQFAWPAKISSLLELYRLALGGKPVSRARPKRAGASLVLVKTR